MLIDFEEKGMSIRVFLAIWKRTGKRLGLNVWFSYETAANSGNIAQKLHLTCWHSPYRSCVYFLLGKNSHLDCLNNLEYTQNVMLLNDIPMFADSTNHPFLLFKVLNAYVYSQTSSTKKPIVVGFQLWINKKNPGFLGAATPQKRCMGLPSCTSWWMANIPGLIGTFHSSQLLQDFSTIDNTLW